QEWPQAIAAYEQALRVSPFDPATRCGLAEAYARTSDPRAARERAACTQLQPRATMTKPSRTMPPSRGEPRLVKPLRPTDTDVSTIVTTEDIEAFPLADETGVHAAAPPHDLDAVAELA